MSIQQVHVFYTGSVQGVGFRFTAREIAQKMNLTGWVKNLSDGRVELLARGNESDLKLYLKSIESNFSRLISQTDLTWDKSDGDSSGFEIIF